jgi:hypothetical protein
LENDKFGRLRKGLMVAAVIDNFDKIGRNQLY